ncbi:MAG: alpha/beta hydrolase [Acidimicrobiales bacterium]
MSTPSPTETRPPATEESPLVVLVHGAFHGAWCWAALQAELDRRGVPSIAVDRPGHGASSEPKGDLHGDADALAAVVRKLARPVVIVGHSYGGAVISQADTAPYARHLVYLTAMVVDEGESATALSATLPVVEGPAARLFRRRDDGLLEARPELAPLAFYARCAPEAAAAAVARLEPQRAATMKQPATRARWREVPSTYVVCRQDQAIHPAAQAAMAERCGAVVELDADHSPFLGMPDQVADILVGIVAGLDAGR